ncbi:hypothetical protein BGW80DRAFT_1547344 [Lactifluus volemus]|nr:hypothetical protein BGW80DRAFT_1547344 [Lactifluus volemus]
MDSFSSWAIKRKLDSHESHNDEDDGEHALLGGSSQTSPILFFSTIGSLSTSELFDHISHWKAMASVNELIAIVPVILNLKGNIEMNLSARLGTASNMGDLDTPSVRNNIILGNLTLLQVQAAVVSLIAASVSFFLSTIVPGAGENPSEPLLAETRDVFRHSRSTGHRHSLRRPRPTPAPVGASKSGFNEYIFGDRRLHSILTCSIIRFMVVASTSMSAACLSAIVLGSFVCFLVVLCRKFGLDPDNIAPPIASCLGDLITLSLLAVMSTLIILGIGTPAPFVVIAVIILFATACASIVRKNERVRPLLKDGWTPLLGAMVISSASGIVLDLFVTRYDGYALLAVAFGGIPGGTGSIFVSRLSTGLHAMASAIGNPAGTITWGSHEPTPRVVFIVLLLVAAPVGLIYFVVLRLFSWLAAPFAFSMLALFFLCIGITISLVVGFYLTNYLWAGGYDPDIYALPIHSAIMDLSGQILLVSCFELASAIGFHVQSLPKG